MHQYKSIACPLLNKPVNFAVFAFFSIGMLVFSIFVFLCKGFYKRFSLVSPKYFTTGQQLKAFHQEPLSFKFFSQTFASLSSISSSPPPPIPPFLSFPPFMASPQTLGFASKEEGKIPAAVTRKTV